MSKINNQTAQPQFNEKFTRNFEQENTPGRDSNIITPQSQLAPILMPNVDDTTQNITMALVQNELKKKMKETLMFKSSNKKPKVKI